MNEGINTDDVEIDPEKDFIAQELVLRGLVDHWRGRVVPDMTKEMQAKNRTYTECADKLEQILDATYHRGEDPPDETPEGDIWMEGLPEDWTPGDA